MVLLKHGGAAWGSWRHHRADRPSGAAPQFLLHPFIGPDRGDDLPNEKHGGLGGHTSSAGYPQQRTVGIRGIAAEQDQAVVLGGEMMTEGGGEVVLLR